MDSKLILIFEKYPLFIDKYTLVLFVYTHQCLAWGREAERYKDDHKDHSFIFFSHNTDPFVQSKCQL